MEPAGKANNTQPKTASLICKAALISGIRLAQLAKLNPAKKKKAATAQRWALLETGADVMDTKMA